MSTIAFIPKRLNEPPVVFRGMTGREVGLMALVGFCTGLPAGGISAWLLGMFAIVPTFAFLTAGIFLWFGGTVMRRLRRGRSTVWLYRHLHWKLASAGFPIGDGKSLITRSSVYRIHRESSKRGGRA
ncbi:MAG: TIGR03750 family conjugal transfer protein [Halomonas sp.]|nr:TIGR03750 family conjugal transfer protein [Halomonas sp.]MCC5902706.1 TIGR03750 family conjugal transfer protein [Halomonas sp.]